MSNNNMTMAAFQDLLDTYGADPARWPQVERLAAEALMQTSAPAMQALAQAEALDALLRDEDVAAPAAPALREAIMAKALANHPRNVLPFRAPPQWAARRARTQVPVMLGEKLWATAAVTAVAAGLLGFVLGIGGVAQPASHDDPLNITELVLAVPDTVQDMQ